MEQYQLDVQTYIGGCNSDTNVEMIQSTEGQIIDANNLRSGRNYSYGNGKIKVSGEVLVYDDYRSINGVVKSDMANFECIGFINCKNYLVGFWTDGITTRVTIDDKIVCESSEVGLRPEFPLQLDINESCSYGEVFTTDYNTTPMIWNLKLLLDAWELNEDTYFTGFNIDIVAINIKSQNDKPFFQGYEAYAAGGSGLRVGKYTYAIRYVDVDGNKTKHSAFTPLIPVAAQVKELSNQFPNSGTRGAYVGISRFGINLKYRVTNLNNYSYVELIRLSWNNNTPLSSLPTAEYYQVPIQLSSGEISIYSFTDSTVEDIEWLTLPPDEASIVIASIKSAKAIRYFDNRIVLANLEYNSRDVDGDWTALTDQSGLKLYPYIEPMGDLGHYDPINQTLLKSYPTGESFKIGLEFINSSNDNTFAVEVGELDYPNRREKLLTSSKKLSVDRGRGAVQTISTNNTTQYTHEIFKQGTLHKARLNEKISIRDGEYNPLSPVTEDDNNQKCHSYCVMDTVMDSYDASGQEYYAERANVFGETFYATGGAVHGVIPPAFATSFNILKTERLNRVTSQGLATYSFINVSGIRYYKKELNKIWYYSNDIISGIAKQPVVGQQVQFVSPLGFHSEIYNAFNNNEDTGELFNASADTRGIDMILYATLQHNNVNQNPGSVNPGLVKEDGSNDYSTKFGEWRNSSTLVTNPFSDGSVIDGNKLFTIESIIEHTDLRGGAVYYELGFSSSDNIYITDLLAEAFANSSDSKKRHEPFYICNIINPDVTFANNNIETYQQTGYTQKLKSIIGDTDSGYTNYDLVDERHEDCIPYKYATDNALIDCFLIIEDKITGVGKRWLDVTYKTPAQIATIEADIISNGKYVLTPFPSLYGGGTVDIYGLYTSTYNDILYGYGSTINFTRGVPPTGNYVVVEYDNRFPIKFFGGDVTVGSNVGCLFDGKNDKNGDPVSGKEYNFTHICLPYPRFKFQNHDLYERVKKADLGGLNPSSQFYQSNTEYEMINLRQMAIYWIGENKWADVYDYNTQSRRSFPRVGYVMRPEKWDDTNWDDNFGQTNPYGWDLHKISPAYRETSSEYPSGINYGDEYLNDWGYGGFKYLTNYNLDYSKENNFNTVITKPIVGFNEVTKFCSSIINSERRNLGQQNQPNLKTFLATSRKDITDAYGGIMYLFDAESSKGHNLYAFAEQGIALLLTNKTMLTEASGNQLTAIPNSGTLINGDIWLRTDIGMNDEMWRTAGEWAKSIVWVNDDSAYMLFDNQVNDLGRIGYYTKLNNTLLDKIKDGYGTKLSAVYDRYHREYWVTHKNGIPLKIYSSDLLNGKTSYVFGKVDDGNISYIVENEDFLEIESIMGGNYVVLLPSDFSIGETLGLKNGLNISLSLPYGSYLFELLPGETKFFKYVGGSTVWEVFDETPILTTLALDLGTEQPQWNGTYGYNFDKYTNLKDKVYGVKNGNIYLLTNDSYTIDGKDIESEITTVSNKEQVFDKEFVSCAITPTIYKPTYIKFSTDKDIDYECILSLDMGTGATNTSYLKNYGKWTNKIPRKLATGRKLMQGRYLIMKIGHTDSGNFILIDSLINYKKLKLQI